MASILKKIGHSTNVPYKTFEVDEKSDMDKIDVRGVIMGSRCYIINTGEVYALNSKKEWKPVPAGSSGGGGVNPDDTYIYDGGYIDDTP
jgi:hypothetical protein